MSTRHCLQKCSISNYHQFLKEIYQTHVHVQATMRVSSQNNVKIVYFFGVYTPEMQRKHIHTVYEYQSSHQPVATQLMTGINIDQIQFWLRFDENKFIYKQK